MPPQEVIIGEGTAHETRSISQIMVCSSCGEEHVVTEVIERGNTDNSPIHLGDLSDAELPTEGQTAIIDNKLYCYTGDSWKIIDGDNVAPITLNSLGERAFQTAIDNGWYKTKKDVNLHQALLFIHSEISEAVEADRKGFYCEPDAAEVALEMENGKEFIAEYESSIKATFEEELADTIIRLLNLAHAKGVDIHSHVLAKMRYNQINPWGNGNKTY